jgi:hypothetical protein
MHPLHLLAFPLACTAWLVSAPAQAQTPAQSGGWTAEFTMRVESAGKRAVTTGPAKTAVSGTFEWASTHEVRGTLAYTQRLRGAVARNQPDRNNEQRYESWLARAQRVPVQLTLHNVRSEQSSGRYVAVDGEGAAAINKANAGKIGKVEHVRSRTEVKIDGADGARMGGAYLQIDRVANQVRFEAPTIEINPARATVLEQRVARLDKAPAAGEWDRNETFTPTSTQELRLPATIPSPLEFVFDVLATQLADAKEITLTQEFKAGFVDFEIEPSRGVITIVLRRGGANSAASSAAASAAGVSAGAGAAAATTTNAAPSQPGSAPAPSTASAQNPCPAPSRAASTTTTAGTDAARTGRDVGGEVGGAILGGGWGRSIGASVGGALGALGGSAKKDETKPAATAAADCPR